MGLKLYLIVVLIYISTMIGDAQHLFLDSWVTSMSSLEKHPFKYFAHFLIVLSFFFFYH